MHYPSAELVAVAWAKTIGGDVDPLKVATTLPADHTAWASTGFTTVTVLSGGYNAHVPVYSPVVAYDCWAAAPGSNKAPWGQAGAIASEIEWATYRPGSLPAVEMPSGFHPARVLTVYPIAPPIRIPDDEAGFARVRVSVQVVWTITAAVAA